MTRLRFRIASIAAIVLLFGYLTVANFVPQSVRMDSPWWPDQGLRLGLDLQGGIHWVIGVRLDIAEQHELEFLGGRLDEIGEDEGIDLGKTSVEGAQIIVSELPEAGMLRLETFAEQNQGVQIASREPREARLELTETWRQEVRERGMQQVLEVLRRRIDDPTKGIPESVVTRQGDDRILVQIPGGEIEREQAGRLLEVTGFLEFKIVQDLAQTEELLRGQYPEGLPEGTEIVFERDKETDRILTAYLVSEQAAVTGDYLDDARVSYDRMNRPVVSFTFNPDGGEIFGDLTGDNLREQLAILLDDRVYSAPTIQSRISMRGQIEGRFTPQEAADLAVVLRAGSLSVPVEIEEERTVGPALGADSIARGRDASILGFSLILVFVVLYYRVSGLYAGVALMANLVLLIGVMSLFHATLTLPGLAGVVLTVGMAVDANVIIFERIREELRTGKAPRPAIKTGFDKALWTILDANITTLITALVLYEFGTGPIKGFAVTLSIGVVTSVFAALVITRALYDLYPGVRPVETVSI